MVGMKILSGFNFLKQKIKPLAVSGDERLDYSRLPVLDADALITLTGQQGRLRKIQRIVKIDDQRYQILYQDVIEKFAELVQLIPASQAHHHAVPGGLFIHTLEVLEYALTFRQQYKLPLFAPQEIQDKERYLWTYAVFAAVLLHDVGKRLTLCQLELENGELLDPFTEKLPLNQYYSIGFHSSKYHILHEKIGLLFAGWLFPPVAQNFLFPRLHIMREIMAYVHGDELNDGIIGKIIREADQKSTGKSLAHQDSRKFKGANMENMGERLMTQLRVLIASNHFVVNKSNGNVYTTPEGYTYIVSKVMADELRKTLVDDGKTDIPHDNNRIFDIFQEYGFAETNENGLVIHYIRRVVKGKAQTFSVLKFKTLRLFSVVPPVFEGEIKEVSGRFEEAEAESVAPTETENQNTTEAASISTRKTETEKQQVFAAETEKGTDDFIAVADDGEHQAAASVLEQQAEKATAQSVEPADNQSAETGEEQTQDLAEQFLRWCGEKIKTKEIVINQSSGVVQKVTYRKNDVIAVVTPRIFLLFGTTVLGLPNHKTTAERIQKAIHAKKLNIPGPRGQIHRYKIKKSENNSLGENKGIHHYLFEIEKFCMDDEELAEIIRKTKNNENLALC